MKHLKGVNRNQIKKIEHPYLILCEGLDEKLFLIYYLEYLIKNNIISDDLFCVYDCGGNEEMLGSIKELVYSHHKSVTTIRGIDFKRVHKNLLHLLMASTDTFVGLKPGEAAKAGAFDFSHHNLNFIRDALLALLKENK